MLSLTYALREADESPVALFVTVGALDLDPKGEAVFVTALEG